jgi:hypothetical protein
MVKLWGAVPFAATSVSVDVPPVATDVGAKLAVMPEGTPLAVRFTVSPATPVTFTVVTVLATVPSSNAIPRVLGVTDTEIGAPGSAGEAICQSASNSL